MINDSSTGGYLAPSTTTPLFDDAFEDFLQGVFAGITGLDPTLVRPRWQPEPPDYPALGTDWMAFGVGDVESDVFSYEEHDGAANGGLGQDTTQRNEVVSVLTSFYGADASSYAALLADGLQISQNRDALAGASVGVVECGRRVRAPVLQKQRWLNRIDMTVTLRREILRTWPILNLISAGGTITNGTLTTTFNAG